MKMKQTLRTQTKDQIKIIRWFLRVFYWLEMKRLPFQKEWLTTTFTSVLYFGDKINSTCGGASKKYIRELPRLTNGMNHSTLCRHDESNVDDARLASSKTKHKIQGSHKDFRNVTQDLEKWKTFGIVRRSENHPCQTCKTTWKKVHQYNIKVVQREDE